MIPTRRRCVCMAGAVTLSLLVSCATVTDWRKAKRLGSYEGYTAFLAKHSEGAFADSARLRMDDLRWASARSIGTKGRYQDYIDSFPNGSHVKEARNEIDSAAWSDAESLDTREGYEAFIASFPASTHAIAAREAAIQCTAEEAAARVRTAPAPTGDYLEVPLPPNGTVYRFHSAEAIAPFEVQTGPGGYNYYVKMVDRSTQQTAVTIFIRAGQSVHVEMPLGNYDMRYAVGTRWYGREHLFGAHTQYYKADAVIDFRIEGNQVAGHRVELILQEGGNLETNQIPSSSW